MKYLRKFDTHAEYETYIEGRPDLPNASLCLDNDDVHFSPYVHDYSQDYLTLEALESGTFTVNVSSSDSSKLSSLSYSLDNGETWITSTDIQEHSGKEIYYDINVTTSAVNIGDKILWKGDVDGTAAYSFENTNITFNVSGNPLSLFDQNNFNTIIELTDNRLRYFFNNSNVVSAENLSLAAKTLTERCYEYMFQGCTSLTVAPKLPAKTLAEQCYQNMFTGCSSLTQAPELPATTLATSCYNRLFENCTSLTKAPELPATTLAGWCYYSMFIGCTSLTAIPKLPATTLAEYCYSTMFYGCTSLTSVSNLPATTLAAGCYEGMFSGCTSLEIAPILPATTLTEGCYYNMFYGCTSLRFVPTLPATTLVKSCYLSMFYGCTNLINSPEILATTLADICCTGMFNGCSSLQHITAMFITTPSSSYTFNWVQGVAANGTFVKNSAASWNVTGANGIPSGWTVETASA